MISQKMFDNSIDFFLNLPCPEEDMVVLDIETTITDGSAMPQDGARIHAIGVSYKRDYRVFLGPDAVTDFNSWFVDEVDENCVLVGHNIKFDLMHLLNAGYDMTDSLYVMGVWDTGISHYMTSGHLDKWPSLEHVCSKEQIIFNKNDEITDMFERGYGADQCDQHTLLAYLKEDVEA